MNFPCSRDDNHVISSILRRYSVFDVAITILLLYRICANSFLDPLPHLFLKLDRFDDTECVA